MSQPTSGEHPGEQAGAAWQPPRTPPPYGDPQQQPPYTHSSFAQAPYAQAPYGRAPYAPQYPPAGQLPYGQQPYGHQPYGQYPGGPPRRNRAVLVWSLVGGGVVLLALVAVVVVIVSGGPRSVVPAPGATQQPVGLGDDPALDRLARECFDGAMTACDDLFDDSGWGSDYEDYGDTCAGRKPAGDGEYCADVFSDS